MAVYAIGDVQGCFDALQSLLASAGFDPEKDRLWFCGDLVNRGPDSAKVLRYLRALGTRAVTVLGNHDLHLLAVSAGEAPKPQDTFFDVLAAPDRDDLLDWLRQRPVLHHDDELGFTLVHAGLPPRWDLGRAQRNAKELETVLRGPGYTEFLDNMYGDEPTQWSEHLRGWDRLRFIVNAFTRMRYCDEDGRLSLRNSGPPGTQDAHLVPWFEASGRRTTGLRILFGHWATLTLGDAIDPRHGVYHLDTGCAWGGRLTAMRLGDGRFFSVPCPPARTPNLAAGRCV